MSLSVTKFIRENASKYSDKASLLSACATATGRSNKAITNAWNDIRISKNPIMFGGQPGNPVNNHSHGSVIPPPKVGISESELRQKHDLKFIIQQTADQTPKGSFIPEADFIKQSNIRNQQGFRQDIEDLQFRQYRGKAGGIVYWGHPDSIAKMKEEGILR